MLKGQNWNMEEDMANRLRIESCGTKQRQMGSASGSEWTKSKMSGWPNSQSADEIFYRKNQMLMKQCFFFVGRYACGLMNMENVRKSVLKRIKERNQSNIFRNMFLNSNDVDDNESHVHPYHYHHHHSVFAASGRIVRTRYWRESPQFAVNEDKGGKHQIYD